MAAWIGTFWSLGCWTGGLAATVGYSARQWRRTKERRVGLLEGRAALVTGGAMGIGAAIVDRFAREGAVVGALDVEPQPAESRSMRTPPDAGHYPWYEQPAAMKMSIATFLATLAD